MIVSEVDNPVFFWISHCFLALRTFIACKANRKQILLLWFFYITINLHFRSVNTINRMCQLTSSTFRFFPVSACELKGLQNQSCVIFRIKNTGNKMAKWQGLKTVVLSFLTCLKQYRKSLIKIGKNQKNFYQISQYL